MVILQLWLHLTFHQSSSHLDTWMVDHCLLSCHTHRIKLATSTDRTGTILCSHTSGYINFFKVEILLDRQWLSYLLTPTLLSLSEEKLSSAVGTYTWREAADLHVVGRVCILLYERFDSWGDDIHFAPSSSLPTLPTCSTTLLPCSFMSEGMVRHSNTYSVTR